MNTIEPNPPRPVTLVHDPIDRLLKADAKSLHETYVDDHGFTLGVMDGLPVRRKLSPWLKSGIPLGFAVAAALFAFTYAGAERFLVDASMDVATASMTPASLVFSMLVALLIGTVLKLAREK